MNFAKIIRFLIPAHKLASAGSFQGGPTRLVMIFDVGRTRKGMKQFAQSCRLRQAHNKFAEHRRASLIRFKSDCRQRVLCFAALFFENGRHIQGCSSAAIVAGNTLAVKAAALHSEHFLFQVTSLFIVYSVRIRGAYCWLCEFFTETACYFDQKLKEFATDNRRLYELLLMHGVQCTLCSVSSKKTVTL